LRNADASHAIVGPLNLKLLLKPAQLPL